MIFARQRSMTTLWTIAKLNSDEDIQDCGSGKLIWMTMLWHVEWVEWVIKLCYDMWNESNEWSSNVMTCGMSRMSDQAMLWHVEWVEWVIKLCYDMWNESNEWSSNVMTCGMSRMSDQAMLWHVEWVEWVIKLCYDMWNESNEWSSYVMTCGMSRMSDQAMLWHVEWVEWVIKLCYDMWNESNEWSSYVRFLLPDPIRSDDHPPVSHIAHIFSTQRDPAIFVPSAIHFVNTVILLLHDDLCLPSLRFPFTFPWIAHFTSSHPPSVIVWPKKESLRRTTIPRSCQCSVQLSHNIRR